MINSTDNEISVAEQCKLLGAVQAKWEHKLQEHMWVRFDRLDQTLPLSGTLETTGIPKT